MYMHIMQNSYAHKIKFKNFKSNDFFIKWFLQALKTYHSDLLGRLSLKSFYPIMHMVRPRFVFCMTHLKTLKMEP